MKCSQCGTILSDGVTVCPSCGKDNQEQNTNVLKLDNVSTIPRPIPIPKPIENNDIKPVEPASIVNNTLPVQPIPVTSVTPPKPSNAIQAFPGAFNPGTHPTETSVVDEPIVQPTPVVQPQVVPLQPMQIQSQVQPQVQSMNNNMPIQNNQVQQNNKKSNTGLAVITVLLGIIALVIVIMVIMNFMSTGQAA